MEELLGRQLKRHESVHHHNGIKSDNRIENLQLRTGIHPKGQSVEEMLEFCRDYIREYGKVGRRLKAAEAAADQLAIGF